MQNKITPRYFINKNIQSPNKSDIIYQLRHVIGEGSQGYIFKAVKIINDKIIDHVAVKLLFKKNENEISITKYLMKTSILEYIIQIEDYFQYNDYFILVMELATMDLFQYIQQKGYQNDRIRLCKRISLCIQELHLLNIIHCDIKPENFLLIQNVFKLSDFGFAFIKGQNDILTQNIGTPAFQAPEIIEQNYQKLDFNVDIWSLGCVFFEILTQTQLFSGKNIKEQIIQYKSSQQYILNIIDSYNLPLQLSNLIKQMIDPDCEKRPTIQQIIEKLNENEQKIEEQF